MEDSSFLPGTLDWWRAWVFLGLLYRDGSNTCLVFRNNQDLLNERFKLRSGRATFGEQDSRRLVGFALWRDSAHSVRCVSISLVLKPGAITLGLLYFWRAGSFRYRFEPILQSPPSSCKRIDIKPL